VQESYQAVLLLARLNETSGDQEQAQRWYDEADRIDYLFVDEDTEAALLRHANKSDVVERNIRCELESVFAGSKMISKASVLYGDLFRLLDKIDLAVPQPEHSCRRQNTLWRLWRLRNREAIVRFFFLSELLAVFVITRYRVKGFLFDDFRRLDLIELIEELYRNFRRHGSVPRGTRKAELVARDIAHRIHLSEILTIIPDRVREVRIVPDYFHALPFGILPVDEAYTPLIGKFALSISFESLPDARRLGPVRRAQVHAVSGYDEGGELTGGHQREIPCVREALQGRCQISRPWTGTADQKSWLISELRRNELIHLCSHGQFCSDAPEKSHFSIPDGSNGGLSLLELSNLDLSSLRLLLLTACWSGDSRVLRNRSVFSVPATCWSRGAKTIVAPLWEVDDRRWGSEFVRRFYQYLGPCSPAVALQRTQTELHRESGCRMQDWALFQVYGNPAPVRFGKFRDVCPCE
jgi:hypothetical protein